MAINYHIDMLRPCWDDSVIHIKGWFFDSETEAGNLFCEFGNDRAIECMYPITRLDVANFLQKEEAIYSGFECRIPLQKGKISPNKIIFTRFAEGKKTKLFEIDYRNVKNEFVPFTEEELARLKKYDHVYPIFILGMERSGTTALVSGIKECLGISGFLEGHSTPLLYDLVCMTIRIYNKHEIRITNGLRNSISLSEYDPKIGFYALDMVEAVNSVIFAIFNSQGVFSSETWVDKTPGPEPIVTAPFLAEIFPSAKFLFMHRDPLQVIRSGRKKFPQENEVALLKRWKKCISEWEKVRCLLDKNSYIELPQKELSSLTENTRSRLADILRIKRKDLNKIEVFLRKSRPEQTSQFLESGNPTVNDILKSPNERELFSSMANMLANWGYGYSGEAL